MRKIIPFIVAAVVSVTLIAIWFFLIRGPIGANKAQRQKELAQLQQDKQRLESTIARRLELQRNEARTRAALVEFRQNVPDTPDLAEFIWANYEIARQAGIKWATLSPSTPREKSEGASRSSQQRQQARQPAEIALSMNLEGGYFQLIDYLIRLEKLRRTVVVDGLQLSSDPETALLNISIRARMFTTQGGLPWTPSDADLQLIYPPQGPTQRGQIPGPPEPGCTPPQPGFSEGKQPNEMGNCSGQLFVPRAGEPVPPQPTGVGPSPAPTGGGAPRPSGP
jgi:Tfp pilus assembly protein PilO